MLQIYIANVRYVCLKGPVRVDPHPLDAFLEHDAEVRIGMRENARSRPVGAPNRTLNLEDLQRYVDERMTALKHPVAFALQQKIIKALQASDKLHFHDVKRARLEHELAASLEELVGAVQAVERYAETGEVGANILIEVTAASETIIADVTPSNHVRDKADELAELLAKQTGFERVVDNCDPTDGTQRVTFRRKLEIPFSRGQIEACVQRKQRELLACPPAQRRVFAAAAIELLDAFDVVKLLSFDAEALAIIQAALVKSRSETVAIITEAGAQPKRLEGCHLAGQPSGP